MMMHHTIRLISHRRAWWASGLILLTLICGILLPSPAWACDTYNPIEAAACSMDVAQYNMYIGVAQMSYLVIRVFLVACYWVDGIRVWLLEVIFLTVYQELVTAVGPLLVPLVGIALFIGLLAVIAFPLTSSRGPINIKMVIIWGIIGPSLLVLAGPWIVEFDKQRASLSATLFNAVTLQDFDMGSAGPTDTFQVVAIYPSADCPTPLSRYTLPVPPASPTVDEQVAALVLADAADLHCPDTDGPDGAEGLPDGWFALDIADRGYARLGGIESVSDGTERQAWIGKIWEGIGTLWLAFVPAFAALVMKIVDLIFTLCIICVGLSFPFGLYAGLFRRSQSWLGEYCRRVARIAVLSLLIAVIYGILIGLLGDAAASGNAVAYVAIVVIICVLLVKWFFTLLNVLDEAVDAAMVAAGAERGPSATQLLGRGVMAGAAVATGGAAMAAAGAAAYGRTGSMRYTAGAMAGRTPLMGLGSVAHAVGAIGDETAAGLYAGHASTRSPRGWQRLREAGHQTITGSDGERRTIAATVQNRRILRQSQGNIVQRNIGQVRDFVKEAPGNSVANAAAVVAPLHRTAMAVGEAIMDGPGHVAARVAQGSAASGTSGAVLSAAQGVLEAIHVAPVDKQAMRLVNGRIQHQPRVAPEQLPTVATTEQLSPSQRADKLRQGYVVQRNSNGSTTWWPASSPPATGPASPPPAAAGPASQPPATGPASSPPATGPASPAPPHPADVPTTAGPTAKARQNGGRKPRTKR